MSGFFNRPYLTARSAAAAALPFLVFFALLTGYYALRPVRDELGVQSSSQDLPWLFTTTFLVSGALVWLLGPISRRRGALGAFLLFAASLGAAGILLSLDVMAGWVAKALFVWITAWSYLLVALFWSSHLGSPALQRPASSLGFVAAGGSAGAIAGPAMSAALVGHVGLTGLVFVCAAFVVLAAAGTAGLKRQRPRFIGAAERTGGPAQSNIVPLSAYIGLLQITATLFYFEQIKLVEASIPDPVERIRFFAQLDLAANSLALLVQLVITPWLLRAPTPVLGLVVTPVGAAGAFVLLAASPTLPGIAIGAVVRRALEYAVARPSRELLFALGRAHDRERYKLLVDAGLTRAGDMVGAWGAVALAAGGGMIVLSGQLTAASDMMVCGVLDARVRSLRVRTERTSQ